MVPVHKPFLTLSPPPKKKVFIHTLRSTMQDISRVCYGKVSQHNLRTQ